MKKQKNLLVLLLVILFLLPKPSIEGFKALKSVTTEKLLSETIEKEEFSTVKFNDGYICIYFDKIGDEECLYFTYIKKSIFSDTGFNLRALFADNSNYYLDNTSIEKIFILPLNNFSRNTIYFSCCEKEFVYPVEVNGEKVELVDVEIKMGTEVYKRTFWFYFGVDEKYPTVSRRGEDRGRFSVLMKSE